MSEIIGYFSSINFSSLLIDDLLDRDQHCNHESFQNQYYLYICTFTRFFSFFKGLFFKSWSRPRPNFELYKPSFEHHSVCKKPKKVQFSEVSSITTSAKMDFFSTELSLIVLCMLN